MNLKKNSPIVYTFYGILGTILLTTLYYFSLQNKYKICALIPAIPVIGLTGLFFVLNNNGSYKNYITNHIKFLLTTVFFYILMLIINFFIKNLFISIISALLIWLAIVYKFLISP
tara:strand:+ start:8416 stop:8760 length:345 start_codon:yes stop_codon:yes gene_type:complete